MKSLLLLILISVAASHPTSAQFAEKEMLEIPFRNDKVFVKIPKSKSDEYNRALMVLRLNQESGRFAEAETILASGVAKKESPELWLMLGITQEVQGKLKEAEESFFKAQKPAKGIAIKGIFSGALKEEVDAGYARVQARKKFAEKRSAS